MSVASPELAADAAGIWRVNPNGTRFGVAWSEAQQLVGYALDGITEVHFVLEVLNDSGHALELHADWPGFSQVTACLSATLPSLDSAFASRLHTLLPTEAPVVFWQRS